jgi:hypothetical protein
VPNLEVAQAIIKECNVKFSNGCSNQMNHPWDHGRPARNEQLNTLRDTMKGMVREDIDAHYTLEHRALQTGAILDSMAEATIGNCGERSFWVYYKLRSKHVANVVILSGDPKTSIAHDFVVIGATNVASGAYSERIAPNWLGQDIVICDPWYQSRLSYTCGVAYPLSSWSEWMPDIIAKTLDEKPQGKTLDRNSFQLRRVS